MADLDALVASPWWRWMPGMTASGRNRNGSKHSGVVTEVINGHPNVVTAAGDDVLLVDAAPDVSAPSTTGCLLALAREAWGEPTLHVAMVYERFRGAIWTVATKHGMKIVDGNRRITADTEAAALIAAILAAPPPGVDRG